MRLSFIDALENRLYDARIKLTMPQTVDEQLVIIDIDEKKSGRT
jgi:adenylate cyclase